MTHLRIEQNTGITEEVSSAVITKLYNIVHDNILDSESNLKGRLHTSSTYQSYIDYLQGQFDGTNGKGPLYISATTILS